MKTASQRIQDTRLYSFAGQNSEAVSDLRLVGKTFAQLQEQRHVADYDNAKFWTRTEARSQVASAEQAFLAWKRIKKQPIAQGYLMALLVKTRD